MDITPQFASRYGTFSASKARSYKYRVDREATFDYRFGPRYHKLQIRAGDF
jgi:hypothetical protein